MVRIVALVSALALAAAPAAARAQARGDAPVDPYGDDGLVDPDADDPPGLPADQLEPVERGGARPAPVDPYGDDGGTPGLVDPYPDDEGLPASELEPEGGVAAGRAPLPGADAWDPAGTRRGFTLFGGLYGAYLGLGVAASSSESDAGPLMILVGAGGGALAGWMAADRWRPSRTQLYAVSSGAVWGTAFGLLLAAVGDDPELQGDAEDQPSGDYWLSATISSAVGVGAAALWARREPDEDDVALVNSLGGWGLLGAVVVGAGLDPAQDRAYALNGVVGAGGGLVLGLALADRLDVPRARLQRVDLGVTLGALAPWVLYGLADGGAGARQATGWVSLATMSLGGVLAWRWSAGVGRERTAADDADELAMPGLLERDGAGRWRVGTLSLRPLGGAAGTAPGLGVDLVGGVW